jgi:pyrroloquinoline quinone (PQQ) biosynthesis protein C
MDKDSLLEVLTDHPGRRSLCNHRFFRRVEAGEIGRVEVAALVGQWWYPLHYFPTFLARTISVVPDLQTKTALSRILYQELGSGNTVQSHESLFVRTMTSIGLSKAEVTDAPLGLGAKQLVDGYAGSAERYGLALGYIYGTEVVDLPMVSGLGKAIALATNHTDLPWVSVHIQQEPEHVESVNDATAPTFSARERNDIVEGAEHLWQLWSGLFDHALEAGARR